MHDWQKSPISDHLVISKKLNLPLLAWALENNRKVISSSVVLIMASFALIPFLGTEFMPALQEGDIMFWVTSISSTSLEESIRISKKLEARLKKSPQVKSTFTKIGRAEKCETSDVNYIELLVILNPTESWTTKISIPDLSIDTQVKL